MLNDRPIRSGLVKYGSIISPLEIIELQYADVIAQKYIAVHVEQTSKRRD